MLKRKSNYGVSDLEKHILKRILNCEEFRSFIGRLKFEESFSTDQDFDAALAIMDFLGFQAIRMANYDISTREASTEDEFDKMFDRTIALLRNPEFQKLYQEAKSKETKLTFKQLDEMKTHCPLHDFDSVSIFVPVPQKTLRKLCELNTYYEMLSSLSNSPLILKTFQQFASNLATRPHDAKDT